MVYLYTLLPKTSEQVREEVSVGYSKSVNKISPNDARVHVLLGGGFEGGDGGCSQTVFLFS